MFLSQSLPRAAGLPRSVGEDPAAPCPSGRAAGALYEAVRRHRTNASPLLPACCPYTPSCSTYAVKALHQHGALRGGRLVLGRLLRCRPGAAQRRGGRDPVPRLTGREAVWHVNGFGGTPSSTRRIPPHEQPNERAAHRTWS
ncbi:membrane protein insertion efficiency factor YidD [Streptomyces sp. NPDC018352]|uniref:membrane protein insertion efficiency factor YidD n=1 Tax=Streptomyces sp. NPDC018352 TaxID=3157194 RepID=UPI0034009707